MNQKTLPIIFLLTIILSATVLAETITPVNPNPATTNPAQIQDYYLREELKTRNEFKAYTDQKIEDARKWMATDGQRMIDENVGVFVQDLKKTAQRYFILFSIGLIAGIIVANALWYFIFRKIENIGKKPKYLTRDQYGSIVAGLINEEFKKTQEEEKKKYGIIKTPTYTPEEKGIPKPPSVQEIEEMLRHKEIKKRLEEEEKKAKIQAEQRKKAMQEAERLQEKIAKKTKKEREKLEKLQENLQPEMPLPPLPPITEDTRYN